MLRRLSDDTETAGLPGASIELIRYHGDYQPHHRADYVYERNDA